jgi:hypothetical protein
MQAQSRNDQSDWNGGRGRGRERGIGKLGVMGGSGTFGYGAMKPDELFRDRNVGLMKLKAAEKVEEELPPRPQG